MRKLITSLLCLAMLVGCRNKDEQVEVGYLTMRTLTDTTTLSRAVVPDLIYRISIVDGTGVVVKQFADHTQLPAKISVPMGSYTIKAEHNQDTPAAFNNPYYYGEKAVTVNAGVTSNIDIATKLHNIKATVGFTDNVLSNFKTIQVILNNGQGSLTFDKTNYLTAIGYLKATGTLSWTMNATNNNDQVYTMTKQILNPAARDYYKILVDAKPAPTGEDGSFLFSISVDGSMDEHHTDIILNPARKKVPKLEAIGFKFGEQLAVIDEARNATAVVKVTSEVPLAEFYVVHNSLALYTKLGIPYYFEANEANKALLTAAGITWSTQTIGATNAWIDFATLLNSKANCGLGEYKFTVSAVNTDRKIASGLLSVVVMPEADHEATGVTNIWAATAEVAGRWFANVKPAGLTFEYRVVGTTVWTSVDQSKLVVDDVARTLKAKLGGLTPSSQYEYRTTAPATKEALKRTFTTDEAPVLPNMNLDTWTKSGKTWYANDVADETIWGTGNEGVNHTFAGGKESNSAPTDDAVKGKAARLESIKVNMVGLAAGNLFTGSFEMKPTAAMDSPSFSVPYTGRPKSLSFWYKYTPQAISNGNDKGTMDECLIYVFLTNWTGIVKSSQLNLANPRATVGALAFGQFRSKEAVAAYAKKTIDIEYYDTVTRPTRILIVATSSSRGDQAYTGGVGSVLYVDEMEFGWE
ncbi:MAG: DUF4493 domain-containing protein [Mucinivorans sp.]